jgi:hypothetical protein
VRGALRDSVTGIRDGMIWDVVAHIAGIRRVPVAVGLFQCLVRAGYSEARSCVDVAQLPLEARLVRLDVDVRRCCDVVMSARRASTSSRARHARMAPGASGLPVVVAGFRALARDQQLAIDDVEDAARQVRERIERIDATR